MDPISFISSILRDPKTLREIGEETISDVLSLLEICRQELSEGPWPMVEVKDRDVDIYIVGDIHGDLPTARNIATSLILAPSIISETAPVLIFLGDYVDRPPHDTPEGGLLTALYVLSLRIAFPDNVVLLRGNHEAADLTSFSPYHLPDEIRTRFGPDNAEEVHSAFLRTFSALPLMARIDRGVLCTHASFPRENDPMALTKQYRDDVMRTLWGDPKVKGHGFYGRDMGYEFSEDEMYAVLKKMACRILVRGHDPPIRGIPLFDDRMITITTSRIYHRQGSGGVLMLKLDAGIEPMSIRDLRLLEVSGDHITIKAWQ